MAKTFKINHKTKELERIFVEPTTVIDTKTKDKIKNKYLQSSYTIDDLKYKIANEKLDKDEKKLIKEAIIEKQKTK